MKTPNTFAHRLASLQSSAWLPPALLLLALSSVFLLGGDRGYFYKGTRGIHDQISSKNMAIVENLSIDHNFVMFIRQVLDADGEPAYDLYNRFPIGSYALIKLAALPFGDNLSAKIYAAQTLMLLFFAAAAVTAYLALRRLAANRWIALTAVLLAFSSPFCLYYGDMISSEAMVDIFAVLLVFHGMVVFEQDGGFRQLAVKACAALLLGWHVYAILMPFIAFGLMRELAKTRLDGSVPPLALGQLKHTARALIRSRYPALGVIALVFGISMLTLNFTSEYFALNRETPLTELPSFRSMLNRTGVDSDFTQAYANNLSWRVFLERQFHRIGAMSLPYAFAPPFVDHDHREAMLRLFVILGIAVSAASLIGLLFVQRYKMLLACLAISGFCWALPMRYTTAVPYHHFEALFYIGVALALFSMILLWLHRLAGGRLAVALSVAAALIFAFSALRMADINNLNQTAELHEAAIADFEVIRNMTDGKAALVTAMPKFQQGIRFFYYYYLSGRAIINGYETVSPARPPDFVATGIRADGLASLTPHNRMIFLYEWDDYHRYIDETIAQADAPLIRSHFDVYLNGKTLIYVKDACREDDTEAAFSLALYPVDQSVLPAESGRHGFQNLDFSFYESGIRRSGGACVSITQLPDYDIARIHTGQYIQRPNGSFEQLWEGEFRLADRLIDERLRRIDETIAQAGGPLIRSHFDVYLNDNALIYVKDACSVSDTDAAFFLALYPADESRLPAGSRQRGFHNLDFSFDQSGVRQSGDRCVAVAQLPDYDIARIYTGQYIQRADGSTQHLWEGEFRLTEATR